VAAVCCRHAVHVDHRVTPSPQHTATLAEPKVEAAQGHPCHMRCPRQFAVVRALGRDPPQQRSPAHPPSWGGGGVHICRGGTLLHTSNFSTRARRAHQKMKRVRHLHNHQPWVCGSGRRSCCRDTATRRASKSKAGYSQVCTDFQDFALIHEGKQERKGWCWCNTHPPLDQPAVKRTPTTLLHWINPTTR
jgi:hypothetical protein